MSEATTDIAKPNDSQSQAATANLGEHNPEIKCSSTPNTTSTSAANIGNSSEAVEQQDTNHRSKTSDPSALKGSNAPIKQVETSSWDTGQKPALDQIDNGRRFGEGFRPKMTSSRAPLEMIEVEDEDENELWLDEGDDDDDDDYPY